MIIKHEQWQDEFIEKFYIRGIQRDGILKWIEDNAGRIMRAKQLKKMTKKQRVAMIDNMNKARMKKRGENSLVER